MILPANEIPPVTENDFFHLKIRCLWEEKCDEMFWVQDNGKAWLALTDGTLILCDRDGDKDELYEFIRFLSPKRIFCNPKTLQKFGLHAADTFVLLSRIADANDSVFISHEMSSREIYDLLSVDGLKLPDYPSFAVDFCRRLNHGQLQYFALPQKCAALSQHSGDFAMICGIASHEKGYGTVALNGILQKNSGRTVGVCCRHEVRGFYEKNGFTPMGFAGYWENE